MHSDRTPPTRRYGLMVLFLVMGALMGAWHNRAADRGRSDMVAGAVRGAVSPPASLLGRASRWVSVQTGWLFHGHSVSLENQRLRAQVAQLQQENAQMREAQIDVGRLRDDLNFVHRTHPTPLAADVIARRTNPSFDTLLISRGSRDDVKKRDVVVTPLGLVGLVSEVSPTTATVVLLTDENAPVSARVQRPESRAVGICKGDYTRLLPLLYLPGDADVRVGDTIVTSGMGGIYPKGLPVGTVAKVKSDEGNVTKTALLRPAVDFDRLEEVFVLP